MSRDEILKFHQSRFEENKFFLILDDDTSLLNGHQNDLGPISKSIVKNFDINDDFLSSICEKMFHCIRSLRQSVMIC